MNIYTIARKKDSKGRSLGLAEKYYLRKKTSTPDGKYFFGGGSLHAPEMVFTTEDAAVVTGSQLEYMAWDWTFNWEAVPVNRVRLPTTKAESEISLKTTANVRPEDLLIHQIEEYPVAEILEVIRHLGEESIAGFSPVQEDEVPEVLAICEEHELGEILQKLQQKPPPEPVLTYSDMFKQMASNSTLTKTAQTNDPLQGMTNTRARKYVNNLIAPLTKGLFSDDSWKPVHELFNVLRQVGINWELTMSPTNPGGYRQNEQGVPISKEWKFQIKFINATGRETILYGVVVASGAGSVQDPLEKYDLVGYVS